MNWSSDINSLFNNYKNNINRDYNNDGKVDEKDKQQLFEKSDLFKSSEISYEDLIQLSTKKDADNDGTISDDEKSFFSDLKNFLYEKIAKNINKDKDLSIEDMLELEKTVRALNADQKTDIGQELEKIQNRMVSNLTSQFFVSIETDEYKSSAKDDAEEIWKAQTELKSMNEKDNNPFNTKFENLLDKLEKRVEKTLSETYTDEQIKEMEEKIKGKAPETPDNPPSAGDYTPAVTGQGFEEVDDNRDHKKTLFYNGELYTGIHDDIYYKDGRAGTGEYSGIYYEQGLAKDGISELNGKLYDHGVALTGDKDHDGGILHAENGEIKYFERKNEEGDLVRADFIKFAHKDADGNKVETTYSKITTYEGLNKDRIKEVVNFNEEGTQKVSTQTYTYNDDGSYTVVTVFTDGSESTTKDYDIYGAEYTGNGVWNGHLYINGVISAGQDSHGRWYNEDGIKIEGEYKGVLYKDGFKFTGINEKDNLYYSEGVVKSWAVDEESGLAYANGYLAQGVYKDDNVGKYYEAGVAKEAPKGIINFALDYNIQGVQITTINNVTTFTGRDSFNANAFEVLFANLDFNSDGEIIEFSRTVDYHAEVSQTDNFEKSGSGFILKSVSVTLKGLTEDKKIELEIDNAKGYDSVDYSVMFADADNILVKGVDIAQALNDNITLVTNYKKDSLGNYTESGKTETLILGSIKDIQSGKPVTKYQLSDKVSYTKDNDGKITIKDKSVDGIELELNYDADGKFLGGTAKFDNSDTVITLSENDSFKVNKQTGEITVVDTAENSIKTYDNTGLAKENVINITPELKAFASDLNIDLASVEAYVISSSKKFSTIKIDGVNYTVTYDTDKIKLSNDEQHLETVYAKVTASDNTSKYVMTYKKEKAENGFKVTQWNNSGNEIFVEIQNSDGVMISKTEYDDSHRIKSVTTNNPETHTSVKEEYGSREQVIRTIVTTEEDGKTTETVYRGKKDSDETKNSRITKTVTEGNKVSVTTFNDNNLEFQTEVKENDILKEFWIYSYNSSGKLKNITMKIYNEDGSEVSKVKIQNANLSYSITEGNTTLYYTKSGKQLTDEQINWAKSLGLIIEDIVYNDNSEIVSIKGQRYDNKDAVYTNFSKNGEKYSYTETLTLSNNATPDNTEDDFVLTVVVENDEQKSAVLTVDGEEYDINVDGAKIANTLDNAISTWEAGDLTHKAIVSDVLFDGISRRRIFKREGEHFSVTEIVALAKIEDLDSLTDSYISFEAEKLEQDGDKITITPDSNNKITVNFGKYAQNDNDGHKSGDYKKAYDITLGANEVLIITKTAQGYEIKDSSGYTYIFNEDGGYSKTKDNVTVSYDKDGVIITDDD